MIFFHSCIYLKGSVYTFFFKKLLFISTCHICHSHFISIALGAENSRKSPQYPADCSLKLMGQLCFVTWVK